MKVKFAEYYCKIDDGQIQHYLVGSSPFIKIATEMVLSGEESVVVGGQRYLILHQALIAGRYHNFAVGVTDTWKGRWIKRWSKSMQFILWKTCSAESRWLPHKDGEVLYFTPLYKILEWLAFFVD